jgi:glycosyltransferase involved in cell wall biosynthesis
MKKSISAVIITMNEEDRIKDCLESVKWADEIIIVDSFSADRTVGICRGYTDKIFQREMRGFGEQKQFAVEQASSEWILSIDADEVVTEGLRDEILKILNQDATPPSSPPYKGGEQGGYDGFQIYRRNIYLGKPMRYCGWYVPILRLFKKDTGRFNEKKVHEEIIVNGRVGLLKGEILHNTYRNISHHLEKIDSFTDYDADELIKKGVVLKPSNYLWYFVFKPAARFFQKYIMQKGVFEGMHGFILSLHAAMVVFINYAKLWERQQKNKDPI